MKCALYVRVSSDRQAKEGDSIPAQLDALHKYASERNYQIIGTFVDDGISGTKEDRDELQNLLKLVENDQVDLILFTKLDRWFRSIRHYINTQAILDAHNVDWLAIWEPVYDTTTPAGRLIVNQMMSIAQFEAENTGQRIRQVQAFKVKQKEVISGSVTPGYRIEDKHLVLDPEKVPAVRLAFETFNATGSYAAAIRATYGMGLPTTTNGMKRLLGREIYTGRAHGLPDFAPRIIDDDLFQSVQNQLTMSTRTRTDRVNMFSGLLRCADCGCVMASLHHKARKGHCEYTAYRCSRHYQRAVKTCPNAKEVNENVLERQLVEMLPQMVVEAVEAEKKRQKPVADARKQREAIQRKIDRLKDLYINDLIDMEEYRHDKEVLTAELQSVHDTPEAPKSALNQLVGLNLAEVYASLDRHQKRLFWRSVIREIRFDSKRNFFYDFR